MANYADDMTILDFLKIVLPHNQTKWENWAKTMSNADIDNLRDLRNVSEIDMESLAISPLLRSALRKAIIIAAPPPPQLPSVGGAIPPPPPSPLGPPPPFPADSSFLPPPSYDAFPPSFLQIVPSLVRPLASASPPPSLSSISSMCASSSASFRHGNQEKVLLGGFVIGEQIVSGVNFANDKMTISVGDVGVVCGVCNNNALSDAHERLLCSFPRGKVNLRVLSLSRPEQILAGGYRVGDAVVSGITDDSLHLQIGDEGIVCGPCNNDKLTLVDERLCCSFSRCAQVNITVLSISRAGQVFQGGYRVGDKIVSGVDYTDEKGRVRVRVGENGVISGPCNNIELKDAHERLHCTFPDITLNVRVLDLSRPGQVFAGGYRVGDKIKSSIPYQDETHNLSVGDVGVVCSGCNSNTLADMDLRICCSFVHGGRVNLLVSNVTRADNNSFFSKQKTN